MTNVNLKDFASLASAVNAVRIKRIYDAKDNYRAFLDKDPTHLWELNIDQDGRASFAVNKEENG